MKNLDIGKVLDERMKEFRDSLPLFVDLKHEALRDRYVLVLLAVEEVEEVVYF